MHTIFSGLHHRYTLHSRYTVLHPSGLSLEVAGGIFLLGLCGVLLNYMADLERQWFRESKGTMKVWGKKPTFITASYQVTDAKTGKKVTLPVRQTGNVYRGG